MEPALEVTVAMTAAISGILGLFTDFRNKRTGKATRWGILALTGILIALAAGLTMIVIKGSRDANVALAAQPLQVIEGLIALGCNCRSKQLCQWSSLW